MSTATDHQIVAFDVGFLRRQFPVLAQSVDGQPLVYLDNAATTQKPQCVIDTLVDYYSRYNANVHRGAHQLADQATRRYEQARDIVASYINAFHRDELIWTSGTTEAINIVAHGLSQRLQPGDEILVTGLEHHANLVPWQQACKASGASLRIAPINDRGEVPLDSFTELLTPATRLVACTHVSNALGTVNPVQAMSRLAHEVGALVLVDGAQGVAHGMVDVRDIGCDFYAFSGHKVFAPTGVGALWGKRELLEEWPVWQTGGEMINSVSYEDASWNVLPYRFEAGTPNIAGVIALGEAIRWFAQLDIAALQDHENALMAYAVERALATEGLRLVGTAKQRIGVLSFVLDCGHPADVGFLLDRQGVAIRTGHHCAEPLMDRLGVPGTARASFSIYNTLQEVDALFAALEKARTMLA